MRNSYLSKKVPGRIFECNVSRVLLIGLLLIVLLDIRMYAKFLRILITVLLQSAADTSSPDYGFTVTFFMAVAFAVLHPASVKLCD